MNSINTTKQMIYITNLSNITDNWDISRLEHDFIFWMNVYRMIVPRNPWKIFPDHNKRVWIGKGRRNEAGKSYVKDGLFVTGSVWVKRKTTQLLTVTGIPMSYVSSELMQNPSHAAFLLT